MPLTHDFKETIRSRAQADSEFRQALLREAIECFINGELDRLFCTRSEADLALNDMVSATDNKFNSLPYIAQLDTEVGQYFDGNSFTFTFDAE